MKEVVIIGFGGHAKVVADIVELNGDKVFGYLDDLKVADEILGKVSDCSKYNDKWFIVAIGNNNVRKQISTAYTNLKWYTAVHPSAVVSKSSLLGQGSVVCANAVINAGTVIGKHCIVNTSAVVEHDNVIGDYCHISPKATLCGTVKIGECNHIGAGVVVKNNIAIGKNITVGVGAAVVKNLMDEGVYAGVPAKLIKGD